MTAPAKELLELLACPKCHGSLLGHDAPEGFACEPCSLFFRVADGLPNMLIDEARPWPLTDGDATG
jgi:uncharacterized protein YbaR (Trm112 family)